MSILWYETNMTSNNTPSPFTVKASSTYNTTYSAWKAFNGTTIDADDRWRSGTGSSNLEWLQLDFGEKTYVNTFQITSVNYEITLDGTPTNYVVLGSDDDSSWVDLGEFKTSNFMNNESKVFTLNSTFNFRYYRINFSDNQGNVNYFNIGDIKFGILNKYKSFILHEGEYKKWKTTIPPNDLVPVMTSNTTPSGIASASDFRNGNEAYYAFDKIVDSSSIWVAPKARDLWIQYEFPNSVVITKYGLVPHTTYNQAPKNFILRGSNDGIDFVDLTEQSNYTPTQRVETIFELDRKSINNYKYYRLYINENNGNSSLTSLSSFNLYGFESMEEFNDNYERWITVSFTVPTKEQFTSDGMQLLSPLLDRSVREINLGLMNDISVELNGEIGKKFSKIIDLKKYSEIISIKAEG